MNLQTANSTLSKSNDLQALGFRALSGESKIQLLPTPWPADQLPPPTSSLMSIASQKGLVAAAGPDAVVVASTESIRKAFEGKSDSGNIKQFQPQLRIPMPMRVSQVAFSADETYLVLSAETGGGLAVYEVQSLQNGSTEPAYQLPTENLALRALIPNPTPEKAELFALVTTDGKLMMANVKEKSFVAGSNGPILKNGVSCVSWSARGKQLVAGLGDGTAYQMTPEGEGKADIPRPPNVDAGDYGKSRLDRLRLMICSNILSLFYYLAGESSVLDGSHAIPVRSWSSSKLNLPFGHQTDAIKLYFPEDIRSCRTIWIESIPTSPLYASPKRLSSKSPRSDHCRFQCLCRYWII